MSKIRKKALKLLTSSYFFCELLAAFRRAGLVGEKRNALVVYTVATSRLLDRPLCLIIKGPSSVGKNCLGGTVLGFFPPSEVKRLTSSATRVWNYLGRQLVHKIVFLEERNETAGPVHPMRLLISEQELIHIVTVKKHGRFKEEQRVTKGPVAAISTTTRNRLEIDDETRHLSIWCDESPNQTRKIMEAAVDSQKGVKPSERNVWYKVQQLIQKRAAASIEIPDWFKDLAAYARNDNLSARRYFPAFLQACRTIALIRSFRKNAGFTRKSKSIRVRFTDFAIAALIFNAVFDESIAKADDELLQIKEHVRRISARRRHGVSADDLAEAIGISYDSACSLLRRALEAGSIIRANQPSQTNLKLYLPAKPRPFLPDPEDVFQQLDGLPERVTFVHPLTGDWVKYSR